MDKGIEKHWWRLVRRRSIHVCLSHVIVNISLFFFENMELDET